MLRKWWAPAVLAVGLTQATDVSAQYFGMPTSVGAARLPDPVPVTPKKPFPKDLVPGPISPQAAPPGPPEELSLPAGHTSAFQADEYVVYDHVFLHVGTLALQRQDLGSAILVYTDPTPPPPASPPFPIDSNFPVTMPNNLLPVLNRDQIAQDYMWGYQATLGYLGQSSSIELSGFFIPIYQNFAGVALQNRGATPPLNAGFINAPPGFEGNNGLFVQGDFAEIGFEYTMGGAELNFRWFEKHLTGCEILMGARYVYVQERFSFFFDDDLLTLDQFNQSNPALAATYATKAQSNFFGAQMGVEAQCNLLPGLALGGFIKTALGANLTEVDVALTRGDGLVGFSTRRQQTNFATVTEGSAYLDGYVFERVRLRAGYHFMMLTNFPEAADQLDFNLANPLGRQDYSGDIFLHGPSFSIQLLF